MKRPQRKPGKTERLNVCITRLERKALEELSRREDRDLGYLAGWFLEWGLQQYLTVGASLRDLRRGKIVMPDSPEHDQRMARLRVQLREEAARAPDEENQTVPSRERKRA